MSEKLWPLMLNLGNNMWEDEMTPKHGIPADAVTTGFYCPENVTDRKIWKTVTDALPDMGVNALVIDLGEGVVYDSHPEIAVPGAWTRDELEKEVARLRGMGLELIPKLNFSCSHDAWLGPYARMISTPRYYEVVADLIAEVNEIFHPKYFHLGMDEEHHPNHHNGSLTTIRCPDLWWQDLYYLFDCVEKGGARPMVWSGYYWEVPGEWEKRMPKECVQSNGEYYAIKPKGADGRYPQIGYQAYLDLARMGYDQLPNATEWHLRQHIAQTVWLCLSEGIDDEHMLGYMACPWLYTTKVNLYSILDSAWRLGCARQMREDFYHGTLDMR